MILVGIDVSLKVDPISRQLLVGKEHHLSLVMLCFWNLWKGCWIDFMAGVEWVGLSSFGVTEKVHQKFHFRLVGKDSGLQVKVG